MKRSLCGVVQISAKRARAAPLLMQRVVRMPFATAQMQSTTGNKGEANSSSVRSAAQSSTQATATASSSTKSAAASRCPPAKRWEADIHGYDVDLFTSSACPTRDERTLVRDAMTLTDTIMQRVDATRKSSCRILRVLDLGCGDGKVSRMARSSSSHACDRHLVLDLVDPFVRRTAKSQNGGGRHGHSIGEGVWRTDALSFCRIAPDDSYDVVFARHVLHLMSEDELRELYSEMGRLLHDGGRFLAIHLSEECNMLWPLDLEARWQEHVKDVTANARDVFSSVDVEKTTYNFERSKDVWCDYIKQRPNSFMKSLSDEDVERYTKWIRENVKGESIPMKLVCNVMRCVK